MSMLDLQGLDFPSWGGKDGDHDHGGHKDRSSKKRNNSCSSKCCKKCDY